jgi:hypothetical protein
LANTNVPAANTSSAELCSITTDDKSLSNELQNAISEVSVAQTSTSKTAKEFEFGSLHKDLNLFETSRVRKLNLDILVNALPYSQHQKFLDFWRWRWILLYISLTCNKNEWLHNYRVIFLHSVYAY